jgi:hypothetical protein
MQVSEYYSSMNAPYGQGLLFENEVFNLDNCNIDHPVTGFESCVSQIGSISGNPYVPLEKSANLGDSQWPKVGSK